MTRNDSEFCSVTALLPTGGSLPEALAYYTEQLGFTVTWQGGNMAGVRRGSVAFNLVINSNQEWAQNSSYSIGVSDLDALYAEYKERGLSMGPLEMKSWGRREFHMIVPSGVCLQFFKEDRQPDGTS